MGAIARNQEGSSRGFIIELATRAGTIAILHLRFSHVPRYFALVPAAGSGSRMGGKTPKQYEVLAGRPALYYALRPLAAHPLVSQVFVVVAPDDQRFRVEEWAPLGGKVKPLYCGGQTRAASVFNGLIAALETQHPGFKERLCDDKGKLRRFVNIYLNEEDIRFMQGEGTALKDGDEISIVPAIAGGR